jgi:cell division protein FtsL
MGEKVLFVIAIAMVLGFAVWVIYMRYQDKWREQELRRKQE